MAETEFKEDKRKKIMKNIMLYLNEKIKDRNLNLLDITIDGIKNHFKNNYPKDAEDVNLSMLQILEENEEMITTRKVDTTIYVPVEYEDDPKFTNLKTRDFHYISLIVGSMVLSIIIYYLYISKNLPTMSMVFVIPASAMLGAFFSLPIANVIFRSYYWITKKISKSMNINRKALSTIIISIILLIGTVYIYATYFVKQTLSVEQFIWTISAGTALGVAIWKWVVKKESITIDL